MKQIAFTLSFIAGLSGLLAGCGDPGSPGAPWTGEPTLHGLIRDQSGNPVEGVAVHYTYELIGKSGLAKPSGTCPSTVIWYSVVRPAHVRLEILRWYTRELVATLVDTQLNAGRYSTVVNVTHATNGLYLYRLAIDTLVVERVMALLNTNLSELIISTPLANTDGSGKFSLKIRALGFGVPLIQTSSAGDIVDTLYISPSIQFVFFKQGYSTLIQSAVIDTSIDLSREFTITR